MENGRTKTKGRQVLLINDLAGYGKVALSAIIPVLSHMGHHIYNLPTALVSNTLDYGNAPEDVRAQADEVIASNDEDGVGHWIRRYLERKKS